MQLKAYLRKTKKEGLQNIATLLKVFTIPIIPCLGLAEIGGGMEFCGSRVEEYEGEETEGSKVIDTKVEYTMPVWCSSLTHRHNSRALSMCSSKQPRMM